MSTWTALCRTVINYEMHVHPLWGIDRPVIVNDIEVDNHRCTLCHSEVDDMGVAMVPAAQLDLSDGASDLEPDFRRKRRFGRV